MGTDRTRSDSCLVVLCEQHHRPERDSDADNLNVRPNRHAIEREGLLFTKCSPTGRPSGNAEPGETVSCRAGNNCVTQEQI